MYAFFSISKLLVLNYSLIVKSLLWYTNIYCAYLSRLIILQAYHQFQQIRRDHGEVMTNTQDVTFSMELPG